MTELPTKLGRYELVKELARGGMGSVFVARATGPDGFCRIVAVKRIHDHLVGETNFVDMFLDEARIAARIDHPNVCQVFDFGRDGGVSFLAMEFLAGESIGAILRAVAEGRAAQWRAQLPRIAATLIVEACEGLHAAHELRRPDGAPLGVVHRDVSPQNLFVTYDGGLKVVDFGVASAADKIHTTATGTVRGKTAYMAPEQASAGRIDRRADLWSLGVVLWELLTMKRLFRRPTQVLTLRAVLDEPIAPPSVHTAESAIFDEVTLRALSRRPEERFATAEAMAEALREALGDEGPVPRWELRAWMDELFPGGRAAHREMVEGVARSAPLADAKNAAPDGEAATAPALEAPTPGTSATREASEPTRPSPSRPPLVGPRGERGGATPEASPAGPRPRAWGRFVLAAVAAGGVAAGLAFASLSGSETSPPATAPAASTPVVRAPSHALAADPARDVPPTPAAEPEPARAEEAPLGATPPVAIRPRAAAAHRRRHAAPAQISRDEPAPAEAPEVSAERTGCINVGMGVGIRVAGGALVEGPRRCVPAPAGTVSIGVVVDGELVEERSRVIAPGESIRVVRPG